MVIGFKKINADAQLPVRKHVGDAGMDVCSVEDVNLLANVPAIVHTGLKVNIPDGYEIQVRSRSGLASKGVFVMNSPGTVDAGYKGEIGVILCYIAARVEGMQEQRFPIKKGDRIAQLVVSPVIDCGVVEVEDIGESDRGSGGFGSTGVR